MSNYLCNNTQSPEFSSALYPITNFGTKIILSELSGCFSKAIFSPGLRKVARIKNFVKAEVGVVIGFLVLFLNP